MPMNAGRLKDEIAKVCPVSSTRVGDPVQRGTWEYDADPSATVEQKTAADNVVATIPVDGQGAVTSQDFIASFTDAEYCSLWKTRATSIATDQVGYAKLWDQIAYDDPVNFNSQVAQDLKAALVSAGVLTQARADEIFSMAAVVQAQMRTAGADTPMSVMRMLYG